MSGRRIKLYYQRLHEKDDDGEYPYKGHVVVHLDDSGVSFSEHFIGWTYKKIIVRLHELSKEYDATELIFQRTERPDLNAVEMGSSLLELLKKDPLSAYRSLSYAPVQVEDTSMRSARLRAGHDTLAEAFSDAVYLRVKNGQVEDPETGKFMTLAYGPRYGWRINRGDRKPKGWIKIEPVDEAPADVSFAERLSFVRWAATSVRDLLEQKLERYYIPRAWNKDGPWISHTELNDKFERFLKEKENAACQ